jgi:heme-degrading monooxygenase HmoA
VSVVKINAITVPKEGGDELAQRFANRIGAVDKQDGFEEFQLLRPADDRETWLVYTRWRDEESFQAWVSSPAFQHGHRGPQTDGDAPPPKHVAMSSELWQFTVEQKTEAAS